MKEIAQSPRWIVEAGVGVAAAVLLPLVFHQVGLGPVLLPMHLPVLILGALAGPRVGFAVGALAPTASYLISGMPPMVPPIAPLISVELSIGGLVAGIARRALVGPGNGRVNGWMSIGREYGWLVIAIAAARLALGLAALLLGPLLGLKVPPLIYLKGAVLSGLPGMALQLVIIPPLVMRLAHARRMISSRDRC